MSRVTDTWSVERGWVFRSDHLTHAYLAPDEQGRPVATIVETPSASQAGDPSRGRALYVVEAVESASCDHTYACCFFLDVTARRLSANGDYDPAGELIRICLTAGREHPLNQVEVVGQMNFGWTAMTATLPVRP